MANYEEILISHCIIYGLILDIFQLLIILCFILISFFFHTYYAFKNVFYLTIKINYNDDKLNNKAKKKKRKKNFQLGISIRLRA
jgi:hypothetical protein